MRFARSQLFLHVATALIAAAGCAPDLVAPTDEDPAQAPEADDGITVDADGVMHFASPEAFFAAIGKVTKMSPTDLDAWEDARGFVSHRREFERTMRQVLAAPTEALANAVVQQNADLLEVDGDRIEPKLRALGYSALATRAGLFYVDGVIHKVTPDVVISAEDGRLETLERTYSYLQQQNLSALEAMSTPAPGVRVVRYDRQKLDVQQSAVPYGCTDYNSAFFNTSDRKVDMDVWTWDYNCAGCCGNYFHQVFVDGRMRGYRKKTIGSGWTQDSYNTSYNFESLEFEITAPFVTSQYIGPNGLWVSNYYNTPFLVTVGSGDSPGDWQTWSMGSWSVGHQVQNTSLSAPYFNKIKVRGKSRGTGEGGWAKICCGYAAGCGFDGPTSPPGGGGGGGSCLMSGSENPTNFPVPECPV